jgi:hypothetical protein
MLYEQIEARAGEKAFYAFIKSVWIKTGSYISDCGGGVEGTNCEDRLQKEQCRSKFTLTAEHTPHGETKMLFSTMGG